MSFIGIFTGVFLARNLDVVDRGIVGQIIMIITYTTSLSTATVRENLLSENNNETKQNIHFILYALTVLIVTIPVILSINSYENYIIFALIYGLVTLCNTIIMGSYQVNNDFTMLSKCRICIPLSYLIGLGLLIQYDYSVNNVLAVYLLSNITLLFFFLPLKKKIKIANDTKWITSWKTFIKIFPSIVLLIILNNLDKLFLSSSLGAEEFAYFIIASTLIATPLTVIGETIASYLVVNIKSQHNKYKKTITSIIIMLLATMLMYIFYSIYITDIISLIFGDRYNNARDFMIVCFLVSTANNTRVILISALRGCGLNGKVLIYNLFLSGSILITLPLLILNDVHHLTTINNVYLIQLSLILISMLTIKRWLSPVKKFELT